MKTIEDLKQYSNIESKLIDAVVEQIGDTDYLLDVANHGAQGGYSGFTYYSDTIEFWNKNRINIRKLASIQADEMGLGMLEMIAGFNCLKQLDLSLDEVAAVIYTDKETENRTAILNAMAWYALEEVARSYSDMLSYAN